MVWLKFTRQLLYVHTLLLPNSQHRIIEAALAANLAQETGVKALRQVLASWPKDSLRSESNLGAVLATGIDKRVAKGLTDAEAQIQANALRMLLADRIHQLVSLESFVG